MVERSSRGTRVQTTSLVIKILSFHWLLLLRRARKAGVWSDKSGLPLAMCNWLKVDNVTVSSHIARNKGRDSVRIGESISECKYCYGSRKSACRDVFSRFAWKAQFIYLFTSETINSWNFVLFFLYHISSIKRYTKHK